MGNNLGSQSTECLSLAMGTKEALQEEIEVASHGLGQSREEVSH